MICEDERELVSALKSLPGQLTGTVIGTSSDFSQFGNCIDILISRVGRVIYNGVPTGVEVSHAMMHGGPFPATTFAHFTSVGTEAIKRFLLPVCYQDCPQEFLPDAIKGTKFYDPGKNPREEELRKFLRGLWKDKYDY